MCAPLLTQNREKLKECERKRKLEWLMDVCELNWDIKCEMPLLKNAEKRNERYRRADKLTQH